MEGASQGEDLSGSHGTAKSVRLERSARASGRRLDGERRGRFARLCRRGVER